MTAVTAGSGPPASEAYPSAAPARRNAIVVRRIGHFTGEGYRALLKESRADLVGELDTPSREPDTAILLRE
jgi:hypothetical protein